MKEYPFLIKKEYINTVHHRSIGSITFMNGKGRLGAGSGVLISKNLFFTAAHNIYDKKY
jgi:V8-like Glu-specific endopeptidase